ncbi:MAG: ABC transporter permease [Candidatus Sericytochromatia bacterium]|nr:ABC transporter permease [Candidatus Tanganyikabacteria bacterium]
MRVLAVAHLTLVELWRQRTQWGFILLGLIMTIPGFLPLDGLKVNGSAPGGRALAEGFLNFAQFVAVFLAISAASGLVSQDLERGTGLLLLSKPLARWQILLGKLLGAGCFMTLAWLAWGLVAGGAIGLRLGDDLFAPTVLAFAASAGTSWLLVAFCLGLSCVLPANAVMGLGVMAWIVSVAAPQVAGLIEGSYPILARLLRTLGEVLPAEKLSDLATRAITGEAPQARHLAPLLLIGFWWVVATTVFARRDLATSA